MTEPQAETKKIVAPPDPWRDMRDVYMDAWAKAMGETVKSPAYSEASGAVLETFLTTSAPFRDAQKKMMVSTLEQLNMPSRADFISLAERLANLELLLDDMAAKLNQLHLLAIKAASQPAPAVNAEASGVESSSSKVEPLTKAAPLKVPAKTAKKRSK
jgi:hypothetical protein